MAPPLPVRATAPPSYIVEGDPISTCKGFWCERWVELENPTKRPPKISDRRVGPPLCARLDLACIGARVQGRWRHCQPVVVGGGAAAPIAPLPMCAFPYALLWCTESSGSSAVISGVGWRRGGPCDGSAPDVPILQCLPMRLPAPPLSSVQP